LADSIHGLLRLAVVVTRARVAVDLNVWPAKL
jgi:hypothetical protein